MSTLVLGSGGKLVPFEELTPSWGQYAVRSLSDLRQVAEKGGFIVHPVKTVGALRDAVLDLWERGQGT